MSGNENRPGGRRNGCRWLICVTAVVMAASGCSGKADSDLHQPVTSHCERLQQKIDSELAGQESGESPLWFQSASAPVLLHEHFSFCTSVRRGDAEKLLAMRDEFSRLAIHINTLMAKGIERTEAERQQTIDELRRLAELVRQINSMPLLQ